MTQPDLEAWKKAAGAVKNFAKQASLIVSSDGRYKSQDMVTVGQARVELDKSLRVLNNALNGNPLDKQ